MGKRRAGLSQSFDLQVDQRALSRTPVELPGYLDDESSVHPVPAGSDSKHTARESRDSMVGTGQSHESRLEARRITRTQSVSDEFGRGRRRTRGSRERLPRKQINISPEVGERAVQLLEHFNRYARRGVTDADLYEALINMAYEARAYLDVSDLPPRGSYGTPMAHAFRAAIKRVLVEANLAKAQADAENTTEVRSVIERELESQRTR